MTNKSRVDVSLLKQLVKTLEEQVQIADNSEDKNTRNVEYAKAIGLLAGISQESTCLINDITKPPLDGIQGLFGQDTLDKVKQELLAQNRSKN